MKYNFKQKAKESILNMLAVAITFIVIGLIILPLLAVTYLTDKLWIFIIVFFIEAFIIGLIPSHKKSMNNVRRCRRCLKT